MRKYFGTDGVRGIANKELTAELAYNLGRAGAFVLQKHSEHGSDRVKVVIGSDTRISKDILSMALSAGFMSMGADVIDAKVLPTPAVAYLTKHYKADIGAVISASHNPMEYNGIKFFNSKGFKLADEIELEIEKYLDDMSLLNEYPTHENIGKRMKVTNPEQAYIEFLKSCVSTDFKGMKVVLDTANGAAYKIAPEVFAQLGAEVVCIGCEPTGTNINANCGSTHTKNLEAMVVEHKADLGLAYDGDADRLIAIDEIGQIIDGDKIMLICANDMKAKNQLKKDTLVVTVMSNMGLHVAAKTLGIKLAVTGVGDRYVLEEMVKEGYSLGGEQSGHMIFLDHITTGDGTLSSLLFAEIVKNSGKKASELSKIMEIYPQVLINAKVSNGNKHTYIENQEVADKIKLLEEKMDGQGRVLIRPSGTEPLVRVMLEGKDQNQIEVMARELADFIEIKLG